MIEKMSKISKKKYKIFQENIFKTDCDEVYDITSFYLY